MVPALCSFDIHRMIHPLGRDCAPTSASARVGRGHERLRTPDAGNTRMARAEKLERASIKAHLSHGSCSNSSSGAAHAGAGSGGDRRSAISRRFSANSILGTATSAIWKAT